MDASQASQLVEFAEQASIGMDAIDARLWRERIGSQLSELDEALDWLTASGSADDAVRLAVALDKYWMAAGRLADGRGWLERVLAADGMSDRSRALALHSLGLIAFWQGDDAAAKPALQTSLEAAERIHASNEQALALAGLARLALRSGDIGEALSLCDAALQVATHLDKRGRSSALHVLSVAAQMSGDLEEARDKMYQRMEIEREAGSLRLVAAECSNLSGVERQLGNLEQAMDLAAQALEIETRQEDVWSIPYSLNQVAAIAVDSGDLKQAATLLGAAGRMVEEQKAGWPPDEAPLFKASTAAARRVLGEEAFDRYWAIGRGMSWREAADCARRREHDDLRPSPFATQEDSSWT